MFVIFQRLVIHISYAILIFFHDFLREGVIYFSDLLFFIVETSVTRSPARDYGEIMSHFAFLIFLRNIKIVTLKQFLCVMRDSEIVYARR